MVRAAVGELESSFAAPQEAPLRCRYKHMAVKGWELPVATALRLDVGPNPYLSADRAEGVRAYVEKREPRWQAK